MEITLNHTIVPTQDNVASAKWYAEIFGFEFVKEWGHFAVVKVNSTFTLDFMNKEAEFPWHHYANYPRNRHSSRQRIIYGGQ